LYQSGYDYFTDKRQDYIPWRNGVGNITLLPPQVGEGVGWWDKFREFYGNAKSTPTLGFIFDPANVSSELAAVSNVAAQYGFSLMAGSIDPDQNLPTFLDQMNNAGMQKIVDEANTQLQAFLAAKNA